jgi:DNA-directed RNA polymerase beta subunit
MAKAKNAVRPQKYFGRFREPLVKLPSLVESQIDSFRQFVDGGAERVFKEFSPISDHSGKKFELELVKFSFGELRWDEQYAKRFMKTYESPLSMVVRLKNKMRQGDVVLIKGSRGVHLEVAVQELMDHPERAKDLLVAAH